MPSLYAFAGLLFITILLRISFLTAARIAILICLENSFWHMQHGSNVVASFTMAWHNYLAIQQAILNQQLDNYLRSKGSEDWVTRTHKVSKEQSMEYTDIILANLLCKSQLLCSLTSHK